MSASGHGTIDGSAFTVAGSGADIWGAADGFHFFAEPFSGDGAITARITGITDTNGWAKAGVMIRESLDADAANVFVAATPEWHGAIAQQRASAAGSTTGVPGPGVNVPSWLRLTRTGTTVVAETSADGVSWSTLTTFATSISTANAYFGLAVTSHNDGALCTATFDNVSVLAPGQSSTLPGAPTNLAASTSSWTQIALSWRAADNWETGFEIERSSDGVNFARIGLTSSGTVAYTDSGLAGSSTYYYRVRATNSSGASGYSNVATGTTSAPPPPPADTWPSADIGTTTAGQTTGGGDAVTLTGSGRDISGTADGFRYYYQPTPIGDCEMIVRVAALQNTDGLAKAGIMLRESLDPGSPEASVSISAAHGTVTQWRTSAGGDTQSTTPSEDGTAPRWLKLVFRAAGTDPAEPIPANVNSYVSLDGQTWILSQRVFLNSWHYIGLAVTSHNDGTLCTAQFDHLSLLSPPPAPTDLHVTHRGANGEIDLAWTYSTSDVDRFEIRTNPQTAGNHSWTTAAIVAGGTRQAVIQIGSIDGADVQIIAFRDFVRSPPTVIRAKPTITPKLSVTGTTSSSITLHVVEEFGYNGPQSGPWSIERSNDGVSFVEIASGLGPTGGSAYTVYADYTDSGLASGVTRYYRARQRLTNGDESAYSSVVNAATTASPGGPPAAPSNLAATALSPTSVQLTWADNSPDEEYFDIGRSTDNTTFVSLGTVSANTTTFTDTTASPGTSYYYEVVAFKSGAGAVSNIATVTTPSSPTGSSWLSQDIGNPAARGSTNSTGASVTVSGSGADVWDGADSFQFAYQSLAGAGTLTARLASMTDTNGWAKAGLMIRSSLNADAPNVFLAATPEWHGIVGQHRDTAGGATSLVSGPAVTPPCWLRLTRSSDYIHLLTASDGVTWTELASWPSSLISPDAYIGFAVTSHSDGALCTATFDNVTFSTASTPPATWSAADIGTVGVAGSHTASGNTITISGAGADIWSTADGFRFVWRTWSGDGVVEARVSSMATTNGWAKAGVMIRESPDAGARNVFAALTPTWHGIIAQARDVDSGDTTLTTGPANTAPFWVRLARTGNTFTASSSADGVTWTPFATFSVTMSASAYFGFAVTSHDTSQLNQALFENPYVGAP